MRYLKWVVAIAGLVGTVVAGALTDGMITPHEWIGIGISVGNAILVVVIPNISAGVGRYAKVAVSAVLAALTLLVNLISGGLTGPEVWQLIIAVLTALGVGLVPNMGYIFHTAQIPGRPGPAAAGG